MSPVMCAVYVGCAAVDPPSARNVFLQLLYAVSSEIERLDALIAKIEELTAEAADEILGRKKTAKAEAET